MDRPLATFKMVASHYVRSPLGGTRAQPLSIHFAHLRKNRVVPTSPGSHMRLALLEDNSRTHKVLNRVPFCSLLRLHSCDATRSPTFHACLGSHMLFLSGTVAASPRDERMKAVSRDPIAEKLDCEPSRMCIHKRASFAKYLLILFLKIKQAREPFARFGWQCGRMAKEWSGHGVYRAQKKHSNIPKQSCTIATSSSSWQRRKLGSHRSKPYPNNGRLRARACQRES